MIRGSIAALLVACANAHVVNAALVDAIDESRLSFHVATIDTSSDMLTVRECLWNVHPANPSARLTWGESRSVSLLRSHTDHGRSR